MDPVKIGLVGYGFGGRYFHAPLISSAQDASSSASSPRPPSVGTLVAAEHPGAAVFDSLRTWPPPAPRP